MSKLKEAHKAEDLDAIDKAMEELNNAWQAASQHMYNDQPGADQAGQAQPEGNASGADDVSDVEYEEIKEDGK